VGEERRMKGERKSISECLLITIRKSKISDKSKRDNRWEDRGGEKNFHERSMERKEGRKMKWGIHYLYNEMT